MSESLYGLGTGVALAFAAVSNIIVLFDFMFMEYTVLDISYDERIIHFHKSIMSVGFVSFCLSFATGVAVAVQTNFRFDVTLQILLATAFGLLFIVALGTMVRLMKGHPVKYSVMYFHPRRNDEIEYGRLQQSQWERELNEIPLDPVLSLEAAKLKRMQILFNDKRES